MSKLAFGLSLLLLGAALLPGTAQAQYAYITNELGSTVTMIDTASNKAAATVNFPGFIDPIGIAVSPDGSIAYVSNLLANQVTVFDTRTTNLIGFIPTGIRPVGIAVTPDGSRLYIANQGDNLTGTTVTAVDTTTNSVINTITVDEGPTSLVISPDGQRVYVANQTTNDVSVISTATNQVITSSIPVGRDPLAVQVSPDGSRLYVANGVDATISVIDRASFSTIGQPIAVSATPRFIAITPDGAHAYVSHETDADPTSPSVMEVISTASNSVTATIPFPSSTFGLSFTPDGSKLFVTSQGGNFTAIVSPATNQIVQTIDGFDMPSSRGSFIGPFPSIASAILPGARSVQAGTTATVFATLINAGPDSLSNCAPTIPNNLLFTTPSLDFQTTDPMTNMPTGRLDTPVTVAGNGGRQTFVLFFSSPSGALSPLADLPIFFGCDGTAPTAYTPDVNTVSLTFSATPVPDVIAVVGTAQNDGIVHVPLNGAGAFSLATDNIGAPASITATVDTGGVTLPVTPAICQTVPSTGQCMAPPAAAVTMSSFDTNTTPTFSVFVTAKAPVPLNAAASRLFVRFLDSSSGLHGETSVAVETQ